MRLDRLVLAFGAASAATLVYGALVESKRLRLDRYNVWPRRWPQRLDGFKLVVLGDFHLRCDKYSRELTDRAIAMALEEEPDMIALVGDYVAYWKPATPAELGDALLPLLEMRGAVVAVPGNHDYWSGDASLLVPIFDELNIELLRNKSKLLQGIRWVGVDSAIELQARPHEAISELNHGEAVIALWHEPDFVPALPISVGLMVAGHSHGGQFRFPGGFAPMLTRGGQRYSSGYYPNAPTPLFVTRGVGTTGPPSRFLCPPEVASLTLRAE